MIFTVLFGKEGLRKRIASLPRQTWYQPEEPEYKALVKLFGLIQNYLLNDAINIDTIPQILADNLTPESHSFYYPWVNAMCEGLQAIQEKNKMKVIQSIETLLELHQQEALEGDWQYIPEGLVAVWALVLWKIANELDIKVEIESAYLPVDVVL